MLSLKTCIEMTYVIEKLTVAEVDRIFHVFGFTMYINLDDEKISKHKKANKLFEFFKTNELKGPFSNSIQMDMLQYIVDQYYRTKDNPAESGRAFYKGEGYVEYEDLFSGEHKPLFNSLKRDGYVVKGGEIRKQLPHELEEAKTESELFVLLDKFSLNVPKGHLTQAIANHTQSNWAAANGQFRTFIESLFMEIAKQLLPNNDVSSATGAVSLLTSSVKPPFFSVELNEVTTNKDDDSFVYGLWQRLHATGSHPGLSDEEDSTFRYHTVIVFTHYLLKRLQKRK